MRQPDTMTESLAPSPKRLLQQNAPFNKTPPGAAPPLADHESFVASLLAGLFLWSDASLAAGKRARQCFILGALWQLRLDQCAIAVDGLFWLFDLL
jgi:hypothetical protein